jgi:uncharacterized membrane protein (UPF0127 family)
MVKYLLALLLILPLAACGNEELEKNGLPVQPVQIETRNGAVHHFDVELALTPTEMSTGLMFRNDMDDDKGMLFFFGQEQELSFWMKNTLIPLDIIFIKADGTIHYVHENAIPHDLTSIPSQGLVISVLEINAGLSRKLGISVGDKIKHALFRVIEQNKAQ